MWASYIEYIIPSTPTASSSDFGSQGGAAEAEKEKQEAKSFLKSYYSKELEMLLPGERAEASLKRTREYDARMLCRVHPERTHGVWSGDSAPWMVEVCEILGLSTFTEDLSCDDVSDWCAMDVECNVKREREYDESKEPKKQAGCGA